MSRTDQSAPNRRAIGRFCESAVARYLTDNGYTVTARNFTVKGGEIDLVAENDEVLLFVEVKGRSEGDQIRRFGRPALAVNAEKRTHLIFAAREYLRRTPSSKRPRFDVAEVYLSPVEAITSDGSAQWMAVSIRYFAGAFRT